VREAEARRLAEAFCRKPFDLERGPLFNPRLLRLGADEHWLLLSMHHIVTDHWSNSIFSRELAALYDAFHRGLAAPLPALPVQYADFAVWQREWLQGPVLERQLDYWRAALADLPALDCRSIGRGPPASARRSRAFTIDPMLTSALKAPVCGRATLFT
jgi:hypothetical protein